MIKINPAFLTILIALKEEFIFERKQSMAGTMKRPWSRPNETTKNIVLTNT
jgi:hypothetical protein